MESLETYCYFNLVAHVHDYSPEALSHLPSSSRHLLLTQLPAVDVVKLEHTAAVTNVNLDEVWKNICEIRLPRDLPFSIESCGDWKDYFFTAITALIVNVYDASHELYDHLRVKVHELLFGYPNFLLAPKFSRLAVFLPQRYTHMESTLTSASSIARYITDTCSWHPKTLYLFCSLFFYSHFFSRGVPVEGDIGSAFEELLSEVCELVVSSDEAIAEIWDLEDDKRWEERSQFHLGAIYAIETILSLNSPKLESLIISKCDASLLDSLILALDVFCEDECQGVDDVAQFREHITASLPYRSLKKICVSLESLESEPSIFAPMKLASVIECQSMLKAVQFTNWPAQHCFDSPSDRKYFFKLSSAIGSLFLQNQFSSLSLESTAILASDFQSLLQGLFQMQGCQKCLTLTSVDIHRTQSMYNVTVPSEHQERLQPTSVLRLKNMSFDGTAEQILYSYPLLQLKVLELDNVSPIPTVMFSECRDPLIEEFTMINSVISHLPLVNPLSVVMGSPNLKSLQVTDASLLTEGILKNFEHILLLQHLDLSHSNLGKLSDGELRSVLENIFSLPCLKQLTLNLSENRLALPEFVSVNTAWKQNASGVQLKEFICYSSGMAPECLLLLKEIAVDVVFCNSP